MPEIEPGTESAPERNARVTTHLCGIGERLGFTAIREYSVPGGRIDVVWMWQPPTPIPGAESVLPIIGFEIESSWRTRKHIKGDLLNLQDLRPLIGVIVLLGEGSKVEATRRFASELVNRPGARVLVWSEEDLVALDRGEAGDLVEEVGAPAPRSEGVGSAVHHHAGKYRPLWQWLTTRSDHAVALSFAEVEEILGFPLPPSSRRHLPHWYGYDGTAVGRAIRDAGWRACHVDLFAESVVFERSSDEEAE